ncbi:DUF2502 domain-containing protein [Yersinia rochesterensis]|uniref:DUF2502 domain-containing protein n=1 Tax=Yersinia rochesterensis TaxID=1604335 RepID=UPI0011AA548E|nr:DUF2502 domain-containing protein [Yersinia rochesterensis]
MKRYLLLLGILSLMPLIAQADVSLDINIPGVSLHLGDQDNRGYYWDGYDWRPPQWWHEHRDGHIGDRSERGYYWDGGRWQRPSEHDGHNPFRGPEPSERNSGRDSSGNQSQHNENNGPGQLGNNHSVGNPGKPGESNSPGSQNNNGRHGGQQVKPPQSNGYRG